VTLIVGGDPFRVWKIKNHGFASFPQSTN
jgi:hypothetical protein